MASHSSVTYWPSHWLGIVILCVVPASSELSFVQLCACAAGTALVLQVSSWSTYITSSLGVIDVSRGESGRSANIFQGKLVTEINQQVTTIDSIRGRRQDILQGTAHRYFSLTSGGEVLGAHTNLLRFTGWNERISLPKSGGMVVPCQCFSTSLIIQQCEGTQ